MLGTLRELPKEKEAVNNNESEANSLKYDKSEDAALRRVLLHTTSTSTFWKNNVTQVESDSTSKELKKVTKTNIVLFVET